MTKDLPFLNAEWFWLIILIAIVIWLIYVWKEKINYPKKKFYINTFIALIAILTLALIALKPLKSKTPKPYKLAIKTSGFKQKQLDSLEKVYDNLTVVDYSSERQMLKKSSIPESVFVLGNGIKPYDLWQLDSLETFYLGGTELKGITHLKYDLNNRVGGNATFKGRYENGTKGTKLILENPSGKAIDSTILSPNKKQKFSLSANLKVEGNFIYQLIEKDSLDTIISKDPLPITVKTQNGLNILIINDFPTFETKYLKNYLSEKGHQVLIRSQITKDRYKYEYFNMANRPSVSFNQKKLEAFDLMIIDANSLGKLSRGNRNSIKQSIAEDGLGLFIQPNQNYFNTSNSIANFSFTRDGNTSASLKSSRIKVDTHPYKFKSDFSVQPIQTSNSKIVSAYKNLGLGRIGTSVIQNSYEVLLSGYPEAYKELWSKTIEALGKKNIKTVDWTINESRPIQYEPMDFTLRTKIAEPIIISEENFRIPLRQEVNLSTVWKGTTYPKHLGWNTLGIQQDSINSLSYYVLDSLKWKTLKNYQTIIKNKRYFNDKLQIRNGDNKSSEPINPLWFFGIFALCTGYLWLESKL